MDQEPNITGNSSSEPAGEKSIFQEKPAAKSKAAKPLIEGINTPVANGGPKGVLLTSSEKKLIDEFETSEPGPKLLTKNPGKEWHPEGAPSWKKVLGWLVTVVVIVVGGVGGYLWFTKAAHKDSSLSQQTVSEETNPVVTQPQQNPAVTTPSTTPTSTPVATQPKATSTPANSNQAIKVSSTPTGYLNVRSTPSTTGTLVTQVYPGETYAYIETKSGWYHITLPNGTNGWVIGTYVTKVSAQ